MEYGVESVLSAIVSYCLVNTQIMNISPFLTNNYYTNTAAKCSKLTPPPNGAVHVPAYSPGSYAYYTCKGGYKVVGNAYRKCQDNCKWEGKRPSCERKY